jgi:para-nitrobenzyl esterase
MRLKASILEFASALAICAAVGPVAHSEGGFGAGPVVVTQQGALTGVINDTTITWLGIPFAKPPTGNLRWQPPQDALGWTGIRAASAFGKHCPQSADGGDPAESEDCLFLNVYVPRSSHDEGKYDEGEARPVMVWIYGGANVSGASEFYDPTPLVRRGRVVAVTVNYRLGALGFLAHPALDSEGHPFANYGVMDQQLALRWVRKNIARFGGDPRNVTIFGESAGGLDVTTHLVSPESAGLFQKAIIESGGYQLDTPSRAASEAQGTSFATRLGCADQSAACLRSKSVADILLNQGAVNSGGSAFNQSTIDGQILPTSQRAALAAGRFSRVPVIQGANRNEGRIFTSPSTTPAAFQATVGAFAQALGKDPAQALALYPLSAYPSAFEAASTVLGDAFFACSARWSSQQLARHVQVHEYEFADANAGPLGATHGAEVPYLMNTTLGGPTTMGPADLPAPSQELAASMQRYWTQFARLGTPNSFDTPTWYPYNANLDTIQLLDAPTPTITSDYAARHHCTFWYGS